MKIKVTGQKRLKIIGKDLPKALNGLDYDPPAQPSTPGNFYVYGPNGEILQEMDASGKLVKDFSNPQQSTSINTTSVSTPPPATPPSNPTSSGSGNMWANLATNVTANQNLNAQKDERLRNPGTYNPFDVKWGQEQNSPLPDDYISDDYKRMMNQTPNSKGGTGTGMNTEKQKGDGTLNTSQLTSDYKDGIPGTPSYKTKTTRGLNFLTPSLIVAGMAGFNNLLKESRQGYEDTQYAKKLGMTDASEPIVKNVYSRGRHVMNVPLGADYAPNMMTPVQFAGRPVDEYRGMPTYGRNVAFSKHGGLFKAAEGITPTEDMLGMPSMIENPDMYRGAPNIDVEAPKLPTREVAAAPAPEAASERTESTEAESGFMMPVKNFKLSSGFGHRTSPKAGASTEHNGIDLAVPVNTPVFAPMDGVVEKIYFNDKGGKQLIIRHPDGSRSGFAHLNDYEIGIGDRVTRGQQVALSGNTGNSTGAHLHFTFRNPEGNVVDPIDYFNINVGDKNYPKGLSSSDHNNPGNIHIGDFAKRYGATPGRRDTDGKVAIFPDMQTGLTAMNDLIFGPAYNNLTISQARNKWVNGKPTVSSPSTQSIVKSMGGDYKIANLNPTQRKKLISEFIKWEDRDVYNNLRTNGLVFKEGGEYDLSDAEINHILANGGQVEYL